jgi:hypothetical protein
LAGEVAGCYTASRLGSEFVFVEPHAVGHADETASGVPEPAALGTPRRRSASIQLSPVVTNRRHRIDSYVRAFARNRVPSLGAGFVVIRTITLCFGLRLGHVLPLLGLAIPAVTRAVVDLRV